MKRTFLSIALFTVSCNADPSIVPDPIDGSIETSSSSGSSSASSASSSASSSSSSSASSSSGGPQGDGSGTRLKRYMYTSADGLSHAAGSFYDSILMIDCVPVETPMGKRCISYGGFFGSAFHDAGCTLPGMATAKGCSPPKYASRAESSGDMCTAITWFRVHHMGTLQPIGYYLSGNICKPWTTVEMGLYDMYAVGPEVDYTQFAAITLEHE